MDISVNIIKITDEPTQNKYTNVLLIDCNVPSYNTFVDAVNADTYPLVYSPDGSSNALIELLRSKFTTIPRLGVCFVSPINNTPTRFLDNGLLFANSVNEEIENANVQFMVNLITEFAIKNIDFLGCDTLNYSNWKNYYDFLTKTTGVIVGASEDKTGNLKYGGDWIMESTSQDIELVYFTKSIEYYSYLLDTTGWITTPYIIKSSPIANPLAMVSDGTYIYGSYNDNDAGKIFRIHISSKDVSGSWVVNPELKSFIWQMVIYGDYLYGTLGTGTVFRIKIKDVTTQPPTDISFNLFTKQGVYYRGIAAFEDKLYLTAYDTASIHVYDLNANNITATFAGSTISTYVSGLSSQNMYVGLGHLFIYNNYLYAATNEITKQTNPLKSVFRWSLTTPITDNSMNFMAQGTNTAVSNSIVPYRTCGWLSVNNQLYVVRFDNPAIISRLNLDNLTDYTYNYYSTPTTPPPQIHSGLANDDTHLYFQDTLQQLYQINIIRPTTPLSTVSIDSGNTYTVGVGNLKVSITDPSNGLNDVYYKYSISGVNNNTFTIANTFATGVGSFSFYINNISGLTDVSYTINVIAENPLGNTSIASQSVLLYTLPSPISNCSVVYANGNINVSITESSPATYYYLNNVSYLYYLYTTGTNQSSNITAYTVGANVTSSSYTTIFSIPNIPVTTNKYKIYLIAQTQLGNTIANVFSTNVYSIPSATVSFDTGNTKTVASGNLQVQLIDPSNISINDVYYYYSVNNTTDASFANTFVRANVSPYSFYIPTITDISNTIYVRASNPIGNSSPAANLSIIVYQAPRQPTIQVDLVGSGNVQVTINESGTVPSYYYLNNISYNLYAHNNYDKNNLSGNTSLLVYNRPVGILSNTNYTYGNVVSYVTGLTANTYTMYVIATNPFGSSIPVYANIAVYIDNPKPPRIDTGNTKSTSSGNLTVSIIDEVNKVDNGVYYWYSTDNISYTNSGVTKTTATNYTFTINNTGNKDVPLVAGTYNLYIRAYNPLGFADASGSPFTVKVFTTPQRPTIVTENTYITKLKRLTISITDTVNSPTNDIYYYYSTDDITYGNSGVAKTNNIEYQFTITDTGNAQIPLTANSYPLYIRAQNSIGNVTTDRYTVLERDITSSAWLEYAKYSNKFNQTYFRNFVDINGECIVRNGSLKVENEGTFTGNIYSNKNLNLVGSAYVQTDLTVDQNIVTNSNLTVTKTTNLNRLNTTRDASFNANIFVSNNTSLNKLFVTGDASFSGNMIVLKNTTLNSGLTVNRDTTIMGKISAGNDATFSAKMVVSQDTALKSSLSVFGQTNVYGYRNYLLLDFLRNINIQADYNFTDRSVSRDPGPSELDRITNPNVLNTFTNITDASFNRSVNVIISSSGINYYYINNYNQNKGGLLTNPVPSQNITNVTTHILVNFEYSDRPISWKFLEILTTNTLTDASYSSLYVFKLDSTRVNDTGSNNQFTINDNSSNSITLTTNVVKPNTDTWISVSQNIINGDSSIYSNGNLLCSFKTVVASSQLQSYISYSIGYSTLDSTQSVSVDSGSKTIKRIIIDYNSNYTDFPKIIREFNTYNNLYVPPVINVNSETVSVKGNVIIQNGLDVTGNTKLNHQLDVIGDASFESNLYVAKNTNLNKQLTVIGDVSFGSNLYVASNATIQKQLSVMGDVSFNKNMNANTISIIGDVSFVSPTGTLYTNNIKLKRASGITGTTTSIDSNTISTSLINVDSLNVTNGIFPSYITATGAISASSFNVTGSVPGGGGITANAITATSITVSNSGRITTPYLIASILINAVDIIASGKISAAVIVTSESFSSQGKITASQGISGKSLTIGNVIDAEEDNVNVLGTIKGASFATSTKSVTNGDIRGDNIIADKNVTANGTITASGDIIGKSFQNANSSFSVSSTGNLTAASLTINGTITIAGGTELATINATNTINAGGEITAASFKTDNSSCIISSSGAVTTNGVITAASLKTITAPSDPGAGGISVTSIKASDTLDVSGAVTTNGTITTNGVITAASLKTITAPSDPGAGGISVTSIKASDTLDVSGAVTTNGTITTNGVITAASLKTITAPSDPGAGGISVTSIKASDTLDVSGAVTGASFKTTSATAAPDAGGISVTTMKASSTVTALSFNATSDKRLKQNINDMPPQWENIKALKPAEYNWTENSKYDCGFIAQQIYTVYPHLRPTFENVIIPDPNKEEDSPVTEDGEPIYYTIDYGKMTPYLCKGLQEVMSETEQLKQEIAELKAQIQSLLKK